MTATSSDMPTGDTPNFNAPWEAKAFAMVVLLHRSGAFTWAEWGATFSAQLAQDGGVSSYYENWLAALETLLAQKQLVLPAEIDESIKDTLAAWPHPAHEAHRDPIARSLPLTGAL